VIGTSNLLEQEAYALEHVVCSQLRERRKELKEKMKDASK